MITIRPANEINLNDVIVFDANLTKDLILELLQWSQGSVIAGFQFQNLDVARPVLMNKAFWNDKYYLLTCNDDWVKYSILYEAEMNKLSRKEQKIIRKKIRIDRSDEDLQKIKELPNAENIRSYPHQ